MHKTYVDAGTAPVRVMKSQLNPEQGLGHSQVSSVSDEISVYAAGINMPFASLRSFSTLKQLISFFLFNESLAYNRENGLEQRSQPDWCRTV